MLRICIFLYNLKNVYENVISKSQEIILLGDLNIDTLIKDNGLQHELCDIYNLDGLIVVPTCFKIIDHIIVRNPKRFNIIAYLTKVDIPPQKPVKIKYLSVI